MADYNSDRTGSNIDLTLDKVDALDAKVQPTATGANVIGTLTSDGLVVENNTTDVKGLIKNTLTGGSRTATLDIVPQNDGAYGLSIQTSGGSGTGVFKFNNKNTMKFDLNNDVSFYEDTGTTAKMVWDASAESLGIGTSSPDEKLEVNGDLKISGAASGAAGVLHFGGVSDDTKISGFDGTSGSTPDTMIFYTDAAERLRIDSSGSVTLPWGNSGTRSIGVAAKSSNSYSTNTSVIEINGADSVIGANAMGGGDVRVRGGSSLGTAAGTAGHVIIQGGSSTGGEGGSVIFETGSTSTERMRLDNSGNLLVGKTSADASVDGFGAVSGQYITTSNTDFAALFVNRNGNDGGIMEFRKGGSTVGSISVTDSATSYNTSSDERLKENIQDTTHAVNIDDIQVREFDWKVDGSHQRYGFIAQELETVYPEAVHSPEDADEMKSVDYSKLVPLLVKEIQTLKARIEGLEK